ncbi:WecB/TagA/CpsF family glycosyltransferase [Acetoanaerobium sticklandii]|uniref:WecB/TagA/CpsF family glycosyltransferase n=1 Tax=Acetoanaerobium sticklandii TaxID=1511 RepID=UPI003A947BF1
MQRMTILGVSIDRVDMKEAVSRVAEALKLNKKFFIVTPNSEIVVNANKDKTLFEIIKSADMVVPDGIGLVLASKIMKTPLKERVTGIDLMDNLLKFSSENGYSVYFIGGKEGIAQDAAENIKIKYPNITIAGTHHGYFKGEHTGNVNHPDEKEVINHINNANPDLVFVALGAPKQEKFISYNLNKLNAKVFMGVGGSLDVYAGTVKRAPEIYQKLGLEWAYRAIKEPWRIKRLGAIPVFALKVLIKKDKPM